MKVAFGKIYNYLRILIQEYIGIDARMAGLNE
jgi:hypothetical protein